ncbi:hypothetical protein, partial [Microcystis aeruginosa]|uniref:hypothetical protein n=1 Tax=Microcystis aeruginosa TaxID=1126 RepID=UPI0005C4B908
YMILIYLVLWQSGFTEKLLTRYDSNLSGFMVIWFTESLLTRYNPIYFSSVKVVSNLDLSSAETTQIPEN